MNDLEIRRCIDRARVVFFDVFDTLILRNAWEPSDIFSMAGRGIRTPRARLRAERDARKKLLAIDSGLGVSLDAFYDFLNGSRKVCAKA